MAEEAPEEEAKKPGSPLLMTIVLVLLLTLVGAGAGFAVGALLGTPPAPVAALPPPSPPPAAATLAGKKAPGKHAAAEKPPDGHGAEAPAAEGAPATPAPAAATPPIAADVPVVLVPLAPLITNLAAPAGAWVRVEGSLLARQESVEKPEILAEKMSGEILSYLRTVRLTQIEGPSGFLAFRDDLDDLVDTASGGDVQRFLIKSLVVE